MSGSESELAEVKQRLAKAEAELETSEKMASLGKLVAGVAHEINTPVGSIHANSDVLVRALAKLREILADTPELAGRRELSRILDALENIGQVNRIACEHIVGLVRSLKSFARHERPECRPVDIHESIESALTLVHHELKNRVEVVRDYGDLPPVDCFSNHLNQVFLNLLVNASQAIESGGRIRITTRREADQVRISFEDSGKGISPENVARIFEPGFTTKDEGDGTGLGLSICSKIIRAHRGRIEVDSKAGEGTTFTITLPVTARTTDPAARATTET